jgi:hypothetical protein
LAGCSLIQEERSPAETTILNEILLADHWMEVTKEDFQKVLLDK